MLLRVRELLFHTPLQYALQPVLPAIVRKPFVQRLLKRLAFQLHRPQLGDEAPHLLLRHGRHGDELLHDVARAIGISSSSLGSDEADI